MATAPNDIDTQVNPGLSTKAGAARTGTALLTGAASGIGLATAEKLLSAGWNVHICDIDEQAVSDFRQSHPSASATMADVRDPASAGRVVQELMDRYGRLDLLVNNAGVAGMTALVQDVDIEDWRRTIDININSAFYFIKAAVPHLLKSTKGSIVNIASTAALFGYPQRAAYSASKWAMIGMTKTLAMELGPKGIRVNAICPGSVDGPRIDGVIERDAARRGIPPNAVRRVYESQVSMRRFVRSTDIANMCAFLASDDAALVSGQIIAVDGHTETLNFPD
jgi:NAD(P)-dependent dehydrogenase (short-subunit alcohol dehydrogenase family)